MPISGSRRAFLRSALGTVLAGPLLQGCGGGDGIALPAAPSGGTTKTTAAESQASWFAAWHAPAQGFDQLPAGSVLPAVPVFENQTLRQIATTALSGEAVRVRVSNLMGTEPLRVGAASVARTTGGSVIVPATLKPLTFGGGQGVVVAPGTETWSDPAPLALDAQDRVAISLYLPDRVAAETVHAVATQTNYAVAGNQIGAQSCPGAAEFGFHAWTLGLDVSRGKPARVVVAFGDSLTDGVGATVSADLRYPDDLSRRLSELDAPGAAVMGVVNAGLGGNRWLHDGTGPSGASRFARDVLGLNGVSHAILLLGINDIGLNLPGIDVSADQLAAAIGTAMAQAQARGIKVYLGTLMPIAASFYDLPSTESKRQALNAWVRASTAADGVIDFDQAVRDPLNPLALRAAYDSGDGLHPNDAGYLAMAAAASRALLA